jgi:hypothetical protein
VGAAHRRDQEVIALRAEVEKLRGEIAREVGERAGGDGLGDAESAPAPEQGGSTEEKKADEEAPAPAPAMDVDEDEEDEFEEV